MTEADWNSCTDPQAMLDFLREAGKLSERKARLFAVACCRSLWSPLIDERSRRALDVAEQYADGGATESELRHAYDCFHARVRMVRLGESWWGQKILQFVSKVGVALDDHWAYPFPPPPSDRAVLGAVSWRAVEEATVVAGEAGRVSEGFAGDQATATAKAVGAACDILRDLGQPFRTTRFDAGCLTPLVLNLALAAYEDRRLPEGTLDNARLAILADAFEEAGCTDAQLLEHLRGPGPHWRGCWGLDAVLDKA
jgi:hypothetical protein